MPRRRGGNAGGGGARQGISSPAAPTRWRKAGARRLAQPRAPFRPRRAPGLPGVSVPSVFKIPVLSVCAAGAFRALRV